MTAIEQVGKLNNDDSDFSGEIKSVVDTEQNKRLRVKGKFIFLEEEKFYIKGVTYGTFCPDEVGVQFPSRNIVSRDFSLMTEKGINAVRTYTVPPRWLLDIAQEHQLFVMVGLPWEQHITFLDDKKRINDIEQRVREEVQSCSSHSALLCFSIGNEIPAPIVRWYGARRIQKFLERLYWVVKSEDPNCLVTYVNYPSTEYLETPFVDFYCFNVYLESQDRLDAYLARLQNLAEDKPLIMAEIGLDSQRNGVDRQAETLEWQINTIFESGCGGCFVFAWTDEWYRGGFEIEDWDFGLTTRKRQPKPALQIVGQSFNAVPFIGIRDWPRISIAICSYNGSRTIRDTLEALKNLDYPDFETIVVDDGSSDGVDRIAKEYATVRVIVHEKNQGLSMARNTALDAATGEIIAYIDDDAYPDPHWLTYLALVFLKGDWAGVGGPNLPPPGDGRIADCVANAPGGPIHVLVSDIEAEHIPGCNMAYWVDRLKTIGGFDARYRAAGDDVDICWRLQDQGWKLGFSPSAVVWHHRRNSVKTYWNQQKGYGKAEALLEEKWPEKYNTIGHLSWTGRLYGKGLLQIFPLQKRRIYHGSWGSAPFQSVYEPAPNIWSALPMMPEWYLLTLLPAGLSLLGWFWEPCRWAIPLFIAALLIPIVQAAWSASHAKFTTPNLSRHEQLVLYALTTVLYFIQPLARLWGRIENGLTPWRRRGMTEFCWPFPRYSNLWSETWFSSVHWLSDIHEFLLKQGAIAVHGGDYDDWDLEIRGGLNGSVRFLMAIEEHGNGKQLVRLRAWPRLAPASIVVMLLVSSLGIIAALDRAFVAAMILGGTVLWFTLVLFWDCAIATASYINAIKQLSNSKHCKFIP